MLNGLRLSWFTYPLMKIGIEPILGYKTIKDLKGVSAAICNDRDSNNAIALYAKGGVNFLVIPISLRTIKRQISRSY